MSKIVRSPYGATLVDPIVDAQRAAELKTLSRNLPDLTLSLPRQCDLELIMNGALSPLQGFMTRRDYVPVLERMRLADGLLWPIPVCLDVSEAEAARLDAGGMVALRDQEGFMPAVLHIEDIWPVDKTGEAQKVYGTDDIRHPGVHRFFRDTGDYYVGGKIEGLQLPFHFDFKHLRFTPVEMRARFARYGWRNVVGMLTRNPLYRAQFNISVEAMARANANLLLSIAGGCSRPGDIEFYTRVKTFLAAAERYSAGMVQMSTIPVALRDAGPREALWHAVIHRNYGCTHFVVGYDHAGPRSTRPDGKSFYDPRMAASLALSYEQELGIQIVAFEEMAYIPEEETCLPKCRATAGRTFRTMAADELLRRLRLGRPIPHWFAFPEVIAKLREGYPSRKQQGFTVFFTGLSGAGKSTIARVLYERLMEIGGRPVTLLDGDIVRRHLSSELGFSKEHRDINVRRIGFVASEITKNRGIAICAPIGPYAETRREVREMVEAYGGFLEVYVCTPLEVCESRDRKGLYAKARAGVMKGFTGVDDPYEAPDAPEVSIDTTDMTPDEAAQEVLLCLEREGFI